MSEVTAVAGGDMSCDSRTFGVQVSSAHRSSGYSARQSMSPGAIAWVATGSETGAATGSDVVARSMSPIHVTETGSIGCASHASAATTAAHSSPAGHAIHELRPPVRAKGPHLLRQR